MQELVRVAVDAMGKPDVRAGPAEGGHELQWPDTVMRQHIALLVFGFTQVGVKPHPILSGQNRALTQQFRAD